MIELYNAHLLCNSIILQACQDYKKALVEIGCGRIKRRVNKHQAKLDLAKSRLEVLREYFWWETEIIEKWEAYLVRLGYRHSYVRHLLKVSHDQKDECEEFFRSEWLMMLTDLDGEFFIRYIRREAENDCKQINEGTRKRLAPKWLDTRRGYEQQRSEKRN